jgi:hypothetical protein
MTGEVACVGVVTVELRRKEMFERRFNGDARANGRETRQRDIVVKMLARDRGSRNAQSQGCSPEKRPNLKPPRIGPPVNSLITKALSSLVFVV